MKTFHIRSLLVILAALTLVLPGAALTDAQSKGTIKIATQSPDRKSTRLNSSHIQKSRMPSSA